MSLFVRVQQSFQTRLSRFIPPECGDEPNPPLLRLYHARTSGQATFLATAAGWSSNLPGGPM